MKFLVALGLIALIGNAAAAPGAHGPDGEHLDAPAAASSGSMLARLADGSVNVPMAAQRRLGLRTIFALETNAAATVELPGRVVMDPASSGRVQTVIGGKVDPGPAGLPVTGQTVRRGQVLAYVRHHAEPMAVAAQRAQLSEIRSNLALAEQRVKRLESLEGTVPRKEIEAARAELESLVARDAALQSGLNVREPLVAPVGGVIARADVVSGQVVEPKDILFEIVDPARILIEATTTDVRLANGLSRATLAGIDGVELQFVGAARALREGTLPLTFRAHANRPLPLALGQPVTVLAAQKEQVKGFVLPAQAITRNPANEPVVWIKSGAERYIAQPVLFRALDAQTVVVTHGLGADNRVVVQGAALIAQIR